MSLDLAGLEDVDTDEYDAQVVLHEWFHYFMNRFGRDDTPGGAHSPGDLLDPRGAFSEAFATAFASMVTGISYYADTRGVHQMVALDHDVEADSANFGGFFDEDSVTELLWDLYDSKGAENDRESGAPVADQVRLGLKPLYKALRHQETTGAFVTLFSFLHAVKAQYSTDAATLARIDALAGAENVDLAHADEHELFNTVNINGTAVGRLYTVVPSDGTVITTHGAGPFAPPPPQLLQTRVTHDLTGVGNKLYEHLFFKFEVTTAGPYLVEVEPVGLNRINEQLELTVNQNGVIRTFNPFFVDGAGPVVTAPLELPVGTYTASVRASIFLGGAWVPGPAPLSINVRAVPVP